MGRSSDTDKEIKTGLKAVLPGAVAMSTSASKGQSMTTQITLTEFVSGKEGKKGSNYRRRTVTSPRFTSGPRAATTRKASSSLAENEAKNQSNTSATTASVQNSEPSALPALMKSSTLKTPMKIGTNSVLPGAVAVTAAPNQGFKGNKYQRKIAASSVNSKATSNKNIGANTVLPGAVADTAAPNQGFKGNKYQRKIAASSVNSKATGNKKIGTNAVLPGAVADTAAPDEGFKGNKHQRKIAASSVNSKATGIKNHPPHIMS